jgi:hypothetical protein
MFATTYTPFSTVRYAPLPDGEGLQINVSGHNHPLKNQVCFPLTRESFGLKILILRVITATRATSSTASAAERFPLYNSRRPENLYVAVGATYHRHLFSAQATFHCRPLLKSLFCVHRFSLAFDL